MKLSDFKKGDLVVPTDKMPEIWRSKFGKKPREIYRVTKIDLWIRGLIWGTYPEEVKKVNS